MGLQCKTSTLTLISTYHYNSHKKDITSTKETRSRNEIFTLSVPTALEGHSRATEIRSSKIILFEIPCIPSLTYFEGHFSVHKNETIAKLYVSKVGFTIFPEIIIRTKLFSLFKPCFKVKNILIIGYIHMYR